MKERNKYSLTIMIGIITSLITVASVIAAAFWLIERKKKREDRELDEYLESSIN